MLGRALIGLGVAVGLMAGLKAIVLWFPPERVALANGWYIMLGALGALSATGPAELVVQSVGWRGLFAVLAAASAAVALLILLVVPEKKPAQAAPRLTEDQLLHDLPGPALLAHRAPGRHRRRHVLVAAGALGRTVAHRRCGARPLGRRRASHPDGGRPRRERAPAGRPRRAPAPRRHPDRDVPCRHARPVHGGPARPAPRRAGVLPSALRDHRRRGRHHGSELRDPGAVLPQGGRRAAPTPPSAFSTWARRSACSASPVSSSPSGPPTADTIRPMAHQAAMAAGLGLQLVALGVFFAPKRTPAADANGSRCRQSAGRRSIGRCGHAIAVHIRTLGVETACRHTRRQATAWRFAAVASMALCVGLAGALSLALIRPAVALHAVQNSTFSHMAPNGTRPYSEPKRRAKGAPLENE